MATRRCGIKVRASRMIRPRVPQTLRNRGWRRRGTLAEVETIRHVIRPGVARIQGGEAEVHLAEFQKAHVGMEDFRDVAVSRVRAQHDASYSRTVSKLAPHVAGMCTVCVPYLRGWGLDVIVPSAPVVPCEKHRDVRPQSATDDRVDLVHGPLHPFGHVAHPYALRIAVRRMLVELKGRVHPRYLRELSCGRVHAKLIRWELPFRIDPVKVVHRVPAVATPGQLRLLQTLRQ